MKSNQSSNLAEAVGRRVLEWKGADFLEIVYLLEEKNALRFVRLFATLDDNARDSAIKYLESACRDRQI
jgi:hypothetical protein